MCSQSRKVEGGDSEHKSFQGPIIQSTRRGFELFWRLLLVELGAEVDMEIQSIDNFSDAIPFGLSTCLPLSNHSRGQELPPVFWRLNKVGRPSVDGCSMFKRHVCPGLSCFQSARNGFRLDCFRVNFVIYC